MSEPFLVSNMSATIIEKGSGDIVSKKPLEASSIVINHATTRRRQPLPDFLRACAERQMTRVSLWADDVEQIGMDKTRRLLVEHGLSVSGFNRTGPFLTRESKERRQRLDDCRARIEEAAALGADHILVFPGGLPEGSRDLIGAHAQMEETIGELLETARAAGVKLALEPLHPMLAGDRSCLVTMSHANALCDRLGAGIGIVVDVYHVWWDERLEQEVSHAGANDRILGFHVNDWLIPTRDLLTDRGMMGDGVIDLAGLWQMVQRAGYAGPIEVEIFSTDWWARNPDEVIDIAINRCQRIFTPVAQPA